MSKQEEKEKYAKEALDIIHSFLTHNCPNIPQIHGTYKEDDKGWFYMNKETADKFKHAYNKYIFR